VRQPVNGKNKKYDPGDQAKPQGLRLILSMIEGSEKRYKRDPGQESPTGGGKAEREQGSGNYLIEIRCAEYGVRRVRCLRTPYTVRLTIH